MLDGEMSPVSGASVPDRREVSRETLRNRASVLDPLGASGQDWSVTQRSLAVFIMTCARSTSPRDRIVTA